MDISSIIIIIHIDGEPSQVYQRKIHDTLPLLPSLPEKIIQKSKKFSQVSGRDNIRVRGSNFPLFTRRQVRSEKCAFREWRWIGPHVIDRNAISFYLLFSHPCLTSLFIRSIRHSEEKDKILDPTANRNWFTSASYQVSRNNHPGWESRQSP